MVLSYAVLLVRRPQAPGPQSAQLAPGGRQDDPPRCGSCLSACRCSRVALHVRYYPLQLRGEEQRCPKTNPVLCVRLGTLAAALAADPQPLPRYVLHKLRGPTPLGVGRSGVGRQMWVQFCNCDPAHYKYFTDCPAKRLQYLQDRCPDTMVFCPTESTALGRCVLRRSLTWPHMPASST